MSSVLEQPPVQKGEPILGNDLLYEVVDGQYVELPPMGVQEIAIANVLLFYLWQYAQRNQVGRPFLEMLFRLEIGCRLDRRPDVAFVSYERWPSRIVPDTDAWEMVPVLAVEVISKTNTAVEIQSKIGDYFKYGVGLVWVIYPMQRIIYVYNSPKSIRVLDEGDTLDGGQILPEFNLPVTKLFE